MPKTKISEWSSTPANNTDIDSINIAEGCAPSGINDAIRELMAQVKDLYSGTTGDAIGVAGGGTGQTSYTNGQLLIGNTTGNTLTKATLTAGTGVSITNGTGSITIAATGVGDVVGPASSTDNAFTRFDSTTGKLLQNSTGATLSDTGAAVFTGALDVLGNSTAGSNLKLYEDTDNGTNYVAFKAPDTIAANVTWTLPAADGTSAQVLSTNGSGTLSWATPSGGGGTPGGSTTQLQYNNAGAFGGISGVTTDGTRMTASTTIGVGGATPSTSGSGITFPATASDSTSANTLDDYEEGTWTPSVSSMTTTGSPAYGGMYTKIGRVVTVTFYTTTANAGVATYATTANSTNVAGLPFSANGVIPNGAGGFAGVAINGLTTAGGFVQGPNSGTTFYFNSSISATQGISASITYYA